ncbi:MAG: 30S ribosomal protein S6 [Magnetovibrio sp.]|nr:30S ribosomal protein S6 [Magnetovibrio sp.]
MAYFESVIIARQDLSTQQVEDLTEQMTAVVTDNGGKIAKTEQWGLRTIAYRIKKNRKGHYFQLTTEGPASAVGELERQLGLHEDVLRSLTVRVDELDLEPSVILASKGSRDDRPRRSDRDDRPALKPEAPAKAVPARSCC